LDEPQDKPSELGRRALIAVPVLVLLAVAGAVLLWPEEPRTAPVAERTIAAADPTPAPPLAWEPPPPKPKQKPKKPKPKPKPVERKPTKVRIDKRAARPVAVSVPSAGISAPTIALGLKPNGKIEVPQDFSEAGWRSGGPEPGERGAAFIDWSDSSLAHPFLTMIFLIDAEAPLPEGNDAQAFVRQAYLEPWQAFAPRPQLERLLDAALLLAPMHHALIYHRTILPAIEHAWEMERMLPYYLRFLLPKP